jgi:cytochrome oxidase Cu insertion factor (SCO1/SenC/PrrC family)
VLFLAVLCVADWLLVEDLGFFGGLGTDPNSMIPLLLLVVAGYLALTPAPAASRAGAAAPAPATAPIAAAAAGPAAGTGWRDRFRPASLRRAIGTASARSVVSAGAVGVILLGAAPMAAAQASRAADPILAESIAGSSASLDYPAPPFRLTDQHGRPLSLASLHGKVVLLTFLGPVCTSDCPLIAQELRFAAQLLAARERNVALVAVTLSPTYHSTAAADAFDRRERLDTVPNWLYLTGNLTTLRQVWHAYGVTAADLPAGAMTAHNHEAYVIDRSGHVRQVLNTDPGPGTAATRSSFAALFAGAAQQALGAR